MTRQERIKLKYKFQRYMNESGWFLASGVGFMLVALALIALEARGVI